MKLLKRYFSIELTRNRLCIRLVYAIKYTYCWCCTLCRMCSPRLCVIDPHLQVFSNARHPLPSSKGQVLLPLENLEPQERFTSLYRCSMLSSPATASFEILAFPRIQFLLSASLSRFKGKRFFGVHASPQVGVFQLWTSRRSEIFLSLSLSAGNIRNQGSSKGKDVQSNHTPRLLKVSQYLHVTT